MSNINLKKKDISKTISEKTGFSKNFSKKIVDDLIEILVKNIKKSNYSLKNIGTFKTVLKKQRMGRNPKTKEEFIITSRKTISFKPSKNLKTGEKIY